MHNFRLLVGAQLLGGTGMWMVRMSTDWLVLELTGSSAAVGVLVALQFLPMLVVGPFGGLLADRYDKRRLVESAQVANAVLAAGLAVLTLTGAVAVWHLYVVAVLLGVVASVDQPSRQVLVSEVVGDQALQRAVSTMNAVGQAGGLLGPAAAGFVIAHWGEGWAFTVNGVVALCVVAVVASMRAREMQPAPRVPRARGQVREGVRYVLDRPRLAWVIVLAGLMGALGMNGPVVLTAFAQDVWGTGAGGFGLYNSVSALGALAGVVVGARFLRLRARSVVGASALFAVAEATAALSPTHGVFLVMLALVGAATLLFLTSAATLVQLTAGPRVRGRVLALYSPLLLGGHALGGLLQGWLTEQLGVRAGLVVTGALALLATALVAVALAQVGRLRPALRRHPWPLTIVPRAPDPT
nr:MFS transporter [Cellulomonas fimi]